MDIACSVCGLVFLFAIFLRKINNIDIEIIILNVIKLCCLYINNN